MFEDQAQVEQLTEADISQLRKHTGRELYAAAAVIGVRLANVDGDRCHHQGRGLYEIDGVPGRFKGLPAVRDWFEEQGHKTQVSTLQKWVRANQPVHGRTVRRVGDVPAELPPVHEVKTEELHGARQRRQ